MNGAESGCCYFYVYYGNYMEAEVLIHIIGVHLKKNDCS